MEQQLLFVDSEQRAVVLKPFLLLHPLLPPPFVWALAAALCMLVVVGCHRPSLDKTEEKKGLPADEDGLITGKVDSGAAIPSVSAPWCSADSCLQKWKHANSSWMMLLLLDLHLSYHLVRRHEGTRDRCAASTLQYGEDGGVFPMVTSPFLFAADDGVSVDSSTCLLHGHLPVSPGAPVLHKTVIQW